MTAVIMDLTRELAGHLAVALAAHRREARRNGLRLPPQLDDVVEVFSSAAITGQDGSTLDQLLDRREVEAVPRYLLTLGQVAAALGSSERTVRRLVAGRQLPAVHLGPGATRIRTTDLADFVAALQQKE